MTSSLTSRSATAALHAVHRTRLPNGLTVLVLHNPAAPVVAINTYVKAGYFDETDDIVGIAHVLEHMFFKGTARRGVGEISKETKAVGGYLNAGTIYEYTNYYTVMPSSSFAEGLDIQADAYANSVIDAGELARELEVIIQEAKRKSDNPSAVTTETLYALLHDAHRIRRWRIGREAGLRTLTHDQVMGFYRNFYTPSNTVLSIAGDVSVETAMREVQRLYGGLPARDPVRTPGPAESEHRGFRYAELDGDVTQTLMAFGWRTVPHHHADMAALDMASAILGAGRGSRLFRSVRERKLAGSVSAYHYTLDALGMFVMDAECEPATARDAAATMWDQVRVLRAGGVDAAAIERAQCLFASRWARRLESTEGQASYLAEWEAMGGWELGDAYYEAFMRVTTDDVTRVAAQYLTPERAGMVVYRPKTGEPFAADTATVQTWLDASVVAPLDSVARISVPSATPVDSATFVREEEGVRVYDTPMGIPVLVSVRPSAVTYMGVYAAGGAVDEAPEHAGITALAARAVTKGTATMTAAQLAEASELLGGSIAASVGSESFGWAMSVPSENVSAALSLFGDVVQHATLTDAAIDTERAVLLSEIAQERDDMYQYPMRLLQRAAFRGHPYGTPAGGTEESLAALTGDAVRAWYADRVQRAPFVIAIVGDVTPDEIATEATRAFRGLRTDERRPVPAFAWPDTAIENVEQRDRAQTALALAFPGPSREESDRFVVRLFATIASGLGGRFFDELRDRQSLAYTVHAFAFDRQRAGMFVSYIATSPEKEGVARDGLLREFERVCTDGVTDEEVANAKRYVLGMHAIRRERGGSVLADIVDVWLFGQGLRELGELTARVEAVTPADILRVARQYFNPNRRVEGVVRGVGREV